MSQNRYSANFNIRSDVFDNITPQNIRQRDISAPAGPVSAWRPAAWLPVQWTATNSSAGTDAFVISGRKVVALDSEGRVVPAGLRGALAAATVSDTVLTYTSTDADWGVLDLVTGARVTGAVSYTSKEVCEALVQRGLVDVAGLTAFPDAVQNGEAAEVIERFISLPVGICAYDVHVWSGRAEEGDQYFHNYSKQHAVQFLTEAELVVPHRVAGSAPTEAFDFAALGTGTLYDASTNLFPAAGELWEDSELANLGRYAVGATSAIHAIKLANDKIAKNTTATPITCTDATVLVTEVTSAAAVTAGGEFYVDYDAGLIFFHNSVQPAGAVTFGYSYYVSEASDAAHRMVHFDGIARPGARLGVDAASNLCVSNATGDVLSGAVDLGYVLFTQSQPVGNLDKVKTAFNLSGMPASGKMPGSATAGLSDMLTLSPELVADQVVVCLFRV